MKNRIIIALVLLCASIGQAQQSNAPSRFDFPSFHIIPERNIFNMNRSPRSAYSRPVRTEPERRPSRSESFALLGTMSYEKGRFAFFDGSSSQYRQVLSSSNSIGGFTITEVAPNYVKLASTNGQPIELPVGKQLKRQDEGEWSVTDRTETSGEYARSSYSSDRRSSSSFRSSASSGPESEEALRRLMARREQEAGGEVVATNAEPAPAPATEQSPENVERKPETNSSAGADEVLRRLLEKREQETK
jgi:hypothetical protein